MSLCAYAYWMLLPFHLLHLYPLAIPHHLHICIQYIVKYDIFFSLAFLFQLFIVVLAAAAAAFSLNYTNLLSSYGVFHANVVLLYTYIDTFSVYSIIYQVGIQSRQFAFSGGEWMCRQYIICQCMNVFVYVLYMCIVSFTFDSFALLFPSFTSTFVLSLLFWQFVMRIACYIL